MARFDGPFQALVLLTLLSITLLGCFGYSFAATRTRADAEILDTDRIPPPADL